MHLHLDKLKQVVSGLPEVERVIVMGYVKPESELDLSGLQVTFKIHHCTVESAYSDFHSDKKSLPD